MFTFFDRPHPGQFLFDKPNDDGSGEQTVIAKLPDEVEQAFKNLVEKEGGGKDAAAKLYVERYKQREKIRNLEEKLEKYEAISEDPEELETKFDAYQELGEDPEKLEEKLEKGQEAIEKNSKYEREKQNSTVADVYDWNAKVLNRLSDKDAEYEIKTRKNDEGEDEKYAVIKTEDGEKDLQEYAQENWDDMMPALKTNGQSNEEEESSNEKKFSKQKSSSDGKSNDEGYLDKWKENNKKAAGLASDEDE